MPSRGLLSLTDDSSSSSSDSDSISVVDKRKQKKKALQKKQKDKKKKQSSKSDSDDESKSGSNSEKPKADPPVKSKKPKLDTLKVDEDYKAAARAVTRCVDMFCKPGKVIEMMLHVADQEAAEKGELEEEEAVREAREKFLNELSPETLNRRKRAYQMLIQLAPRLKGLINDPAKHGELRRVVSIMNKTISMTRSDDTARLKDKIGHYAAPNPAMASLTPPVYTGSGSRSNLGVNHPVLARFLCPITLLATFDEDPVAGRQKLMNGKIKMSTKIYPTFFWDGDPPGKDYDATNMHKGLFRGYLLERVCIS
ncbi:hypothetical protein J3R83DRAFT_5824 [Lanmaoa asiatica]|nr:hypothetical protein J3R83DRAFT_5824 [Lanmaoa asiatica]